MFFIIPPVMDVHMMLKRDNAKQGIGQQNVFKERLGII